MKVIAPNKLELIDCSLPEDDSIDGPEWDNETTYNKADIVRYKHQRYESLVSENTGNNPENTSSGVSAKWKPLGATRPWLMLDEFIETQTVGNDGALLQITVPFNRATAFALLNVEGLSAHVIVQDDQEETFFEQTYNLTRDISDFSLYEYNYSLVETKINVTATNIPMPIIGKLHIDIDPGEGSSAKLGMLVAGPEQYLGGTKYDAEIGVTDYSKKETNEFGVATLVRRSYANTASLELYLHPSRMDFISRTLKNLRATPCVWIGDNRDNGYVCLTLYGWIEDWRISCVGPNEAQVSIEIQGLI